MRQKHRALLDTLTKSFPDDVVQRWGRMIRDWSLDHTKPDPYTQPVIST
jgi:hypothetical protein